MTRRFLVSWAIAAGPNFKGGKSADLAWAQISALLSEIETAGGILTLDTADGSKIGARSLQVRTEKGNSVVTLGEESGDDYDVRSIVNVRPSGGEIDILGDRWDSKAICADFSVVRQIFDEFFVRGDVSHPLFESKR